MYQTAVNKEPALTGVTADHIIAIDGSAAEIIQTNTICIFHYQRKSYCNVLANTQPIYMLITCSPLIVKTWVGPGHPNETRPFYLDFCFDWRANPFRLFALGLLDGKSHFKDSKEKFTSYTCRDDVSKVKSTVELHDKLKWSASKAGREKRTKQRRQFNSHLWTVDEQ